MTFSIKRFLVRKWRRYLYTLLDFLSFEPIKQSISPVFVAGCGHSGTTLLATILGRNDDLLSIGYETEAFLPSKSLLFAKEFVISWNLLAKQFGKKTFIEKTPKHILCLKRILKVLPEAKIILIIRDGRDVVSSLKKRFSETEISYLIDRWIIDNKPVVEWKEKANVYILKYEDLVKKPELTIREACKFLKIDYSKSMITPETSSHNSIDRGDFASMRSKQVKQPIYDNTGKWKKGLNNDELEIFWSKAGNMMEILGYKEK